MPAVLGAIVEARQTNTPCAMCQQMIGSLMANIEFRTGKPVIFRGSALHVYESAPGPLGRAMPVAGLPDPFDLPGPPRMEDVHGLHAAVP